MQQTEKDYKNFWCMLARVTFERLRELSAISGQTGESS